MFYIPKEKTASQYLNAPITVLIFLTTISCVAQQQMDAKPDDHIAQGIKLCNKQLSFKEICKC